MCNGVQVDFKRHSIIRFIVLNQAGAPLSKRPAVFWRIPLSGEGKPVLDSATSYDVTLDSTGGFLGCALGENEIVRIEGVSDDTNTNPVDPPWAENLRPRSGAIGWHVVRIGKKR